MVDLFERLGGGQPPPTAEAKIKYRAAAKPPLLLDWLRTRWPGTTVAARDLYHHGPRPVRDNRKIALDLAEELVAQGALTPIKTHRYDRKAWQIVGKTSKNTKSAQ
jgi:hypothetical protein